MTRRAQTINWREVLLLSGLMVLIVLLWNTVAVYPLKVLVIFFHELSHGLAALLTGGQIAKIEVMDLERGVCGTSGGIQFVILSAGYLGSLLWGGAILVLAARTHADRALSGMLGGIVLTVTLLQVRPTASFGFLFGLLAGAGLVVAGVRLSEKANDYLLRVIGLTSCLYAVLDLKSDLLSQPGPKGSDAYRLAELTGVPMMVWGGVWLVLAVAGALYFLFLACRQGEPK